MRAYAAAPAAPARLVPRGVRRRRCALSSRRAAAMRAAPLARGGSGWAEAADRRRSRAPLRGARRHPAPGPALRSARSLGRAPGFAAHGGPRGGARRRRDHGRRSRSPTTCWCGRCPSRRSDRLVQLWQAQGRPRLRRASSCRRPTTATGSARSTSFEAMGAYHTGAAQPRRARASPSGSSPPRVTAELLPLLGVAAAARPRLLAGGRSRGAAGTVLLSYGLWQARFGGDPGVVGRKLLLDDEPVTVIGVMPRGLPLSRAARRSSGGRCGSRARTSSDRDDTYLDVRRRGCGRACRSSRPGPR